MTTYVIGDLHGHYRDYQRLLIDQGLCDTTLKWTGGDSSLWLMGDFFDRGASGIGCVELTMDLALQAPQSGGQVGSLLGNHELMMLCAYKFENHTTAQNESVYDLWLRWGGIESDFASLNQDHVDWIAELPAMKLIEDNLLIHADAMLYVNFGITIDMVNQGFRDLIESDDLAKWEHTLSAFSEHMTFSSLDITGKKRASQILALYGGSKIIHGHTPIPYARQIEPETVSTAWEYADGRCVNVDGGMYMGSPGFVHQL